MGQPVVHFEIGGPDRVALQQFYGGLFGWEIEDMPAGNYSMVKTGGPVGIGGGIAGAPDDSPVSRWVTFYVHVDDIQGYLDKAEQMGGKTLIPPTPISDGEAFAWFNDPQGNCIGLFSGKIG